LLKSDTCSVHIPEIDTEVGAGILCGRFTTVEGLLMAICEQLERQAPFFVGDSCTDEERRKFVELIERMKKFVKMEEECTLVLDDPSGNSYIQVCVLEIRRFSIRTKEYRFSERPQGTFLAEEIFPGRTLLPGRTPIISLLGKTF